MCFVDDMKRQNGLPAVRSKPHIKTALRVRQWRNWVSRRNQQSQSFDENFLDPLWSARSYIQGLCLLRAVFKTYSTALSSDERRARGKKNTQATLPENQAQARMSGFSRSHVASFLSGKNFQKNASSEGYFFKGHSHFVKLIYKSSEAHAERQTDTRKHRHNCGAPLTHQR
jgi:hypothetical protein